jgi:hypothetical protein
MMMIYILNQVKLNAVEEARNQFSKGLYMTNEAADVSAALA